MNDALVNVFEGVVNLVVAGISAKVAGRMKNTREHLLPRVVFTLLYGSSRKTRIDFVRVLLDDHAKSPNEQQRRFQRRHYEIALAMIDAGTDYKKFTEIDDAVREGKAAGARGNDPLMQPTFKARWELSPNDAGVIQVKYREGN